MKNIIKITEDRIMSLKADVKILEERKAKIGDDISRANFEIEEVQTELLVLKKAFESKELNA